LYIFTGEDEILSYHFQCRVIDAHCDTVQNFTGEKGDYDFTSNNQCGHVDLPRLEAGGIKVQFFALFIEEKFRVTGAFSRGFQLLEYYFSTIEKLTGQVETIYSRKDLEKVKQSSKIGALLTIEGGEALEGSIQNLKEFFNLGVRGLGLTWNNQNQLAAGISANTDNGLTPLGKKVIKEMNRLGMLVDLAHLGTKGYNEALDLTESPAIVSHANTKKICDHPRNLSDAQLRCLKQNGGVVGMTFCPDFIHQASPSMEKLLDHFEHVAGVAGVESVGIGSDFDGISYPVEGLDDASYVPNLTRGLVSRGFSKDEIGKILYGNFERVLKAVMP